jgi:transposase
MSVIIGIDPHKRLHAACAIDEHETELAHVEVRTSTRQVTDLLAWAASFDCRSWAIESAGGLGYLLAQQLVARGEHVVDVPATLSSRVRLLGSGRSTKNDANDARAVAVAALRAPSLAQVRVEDHVTILRLLAKNQLDISRAKSRACCRLHALVAELVPGGIRKEVVVNQAEQILAGIAATSATQRQRLDLANDTLSEIVMLDDRAKRNKTRITDEVIASGSSITEIFGVGPILAAMIIGYTGDIRRFPTPGHYAAYTGTAPIEFSSSGRTVHRLSRRGNRTLNHALHIAAVTQIRHAHSEGRGYYDRKLEQGKTPREARRALKRQISDRVYRQLRLDLSTK